MKSKNILAGLLALTFVFGGATMPAAVSSFDTAITASADSEVPESGELGDNITWKLDEDGTLVISGTGKMDFGGSGSPWGDNEVIKSVYIKNGITDIGKDAFNFCMSLTEISIPSSVTSIGNGAFYYCPELTEINIPNGVASIGINAFSHCEQLETINIPDSVASIGAGAFSNTAWLQKKQKEDPLVVVNNILIDGTKCEGSVTIPDDVKSINDSAFSTNVNLTEITIPDGVKKIGHDAFYGCTELTNVTIADSVRDIDYNAFVACEKLKEITLPASLEHLGNGAFTGTQLLKDLSTDPQKAVVIDNWLISMPTSTEPVFPEGVVGIADNVYIQGEFQLPDTLKYIGKYAVTDAIREKSKMHDKLEIPAGVIRIGEMAFNYKAKELVLHEGLEYIGGGAFQNITAKEVLVPGTVTYIGEKALGYLDNEKINGFTIKGYNGTAAQMYAKANGFVFVSLGNKPPMKGDLNIDGTVNVTDVSMLAAHVKGVKKMYDTAAADLNGDGSINVTDISQLAAHVKGIKKLS